MDFLLRYGCSEYQGFLFSPAVPADDVRRAAAQRHRNHSTRHDSFMRAVTMRSNDRKNAVFAVLVLAAAALPSPAAAALVRPIRFERLSLEEGLSQAAVMDVLQDRRGYMWLATEDGLNRYDGTAFKVYRHDATDLATLPDSFIWDAEEDASGSVWVATRGGLGRWDRATDRVVRKDTPGVRNIRVLRYQARGNALWIGTRESGLLRLDLATGALQRFAHDAADPGSLVDDRVYALYVDGKDRLWVGTDGGLELLNADGKGFTHHVPSDSDRSSLSDARVRAILADDMGGLWVGTSGGGLNRLDLASGRLRALPPRPRGRRPAWPTTTCAPSCRTRAAGSGSAPAAGLELYDPERGDVCPLPARIPRNPSSLSDDHVIVAGPGPRRRDLGRHAHGRRAQVEPAELAVRPRRPRARQPQGAGRRPGHRVRGGPRGRPLDRHLRRRPLRDGPVERRHEGLSPRRAQPPEPAQRPGDGAAPRPPRRPLDRHARLRPGADDAGRPAPSSPTPTIRRSRRA